MSSPTATPPRTPFPASPLLAALNAEQDRLLDDVETGRLQECDWQELLTFLQDFEHLRNRQARIDHAIVTACNNSDLAEHLLRRTTRTLLIEALRISPTEATRRVAHTDALAERNTMTGDPLDPQHPWLGALADTGIPSPEVITIAVKCLTVLKGKYGANQAQLDWADQELARNAHLFGPKEFRAIAQAVINFLFPDGLLDDEQIHEARTFTITQQPDGSYKVEGTLTATCGAQWTAILSPLAKPRTEDADGKDTRNPGQRRHDAFEEAAHRLLKAPDLPDSGGTPCTVIAVATIDDLLRKTGHATTSDGQHISIPELLKLVDEANIYPTIFTKTGIPLSMGRSSRVATKHQTMALIARDGGCSFPGCDHPPEWSDRHHIIYWRDNGLSDIDNLTLLCGYHHDKFESRGWTCHMSPEGLPTWIPPTWIDPDQKPLINTRILQHIKTLFAPHLPDPDDPAEPSRNGAKCQPNWGRPQ